MEPLDDQELTNLLKTWHAPPAPANLRPPRRGPSEIWQWVLRGSIRVPVPALLFATAMLALSLWWGWTARRTAEPRPGTVSFAQFEPAKQLQPRIIRSRYECQ